MPMQPWGEHVLVVGIASLRDEMDRERVRLHIMLGLVIVSNLPFLQSLDSMGSEGIAPAL